MCPLWETHLQAHISLPCWHWGCSSFGGLKSLGVPRFCPLAVGLDSFSFFKQLQMSIDLYFISLPHPPIIEMQKIPNRVSFRLGSGYNNWIHCVLRTTGLGNWLRGTGNMLLF